MWQSHSIVSLRATKYFIRFLCVPPFQGIHRSNCAYYILLLLTFEAIFSIAFYMKLFYNGEFKMHWVKYDTVYIVEQMTWFFMGHAYSIAVILSLCSRAAQQELIKQMTVLDIRLESQLKVDLSFRRLNIEFSVLSYGSSLYLLVYYVYKSIYKKLNLQSLVYSFCVSFAANFFYIYAFYTVYWARIFINRAGHIMDAFMVAISQKHISNRTLTIIMELITLLFDVRESIQNAFGSMLCIIILVNTILIAEGMFGLIHNFERNKDCIFFWLEYLWWSLTLWSEFIYVIVFFSRIGDVVSSTTQSTKVRFEKGLLFLAAGCENAGNRFEKIHCL